MEKKRIPITFKASPCRTCPSDCYISRIPKQDRWIEVEGNFKDGFTKQHTVSIGITEWIGPLIRHAPELDGNIDVWEIFIIASVVHVNHDEDFCTINLLTNKITGLPLNEIEEAFAKMKFCPYDSRDI